MYDQPRYKPYGPAPLFADDAAMRTAPAGTEPARSGPFAATSSGQLGEREAAQNQRALQARENPFPLTAEFLQRGRERYEIYCEPCHSPVGDGDGYIVRRGFPAPPSYHTDYLRTIGDRHLFDVIGNGYGVMYPYADRIEPVERWAVVAYIRALQLSQNTAVASLPAAQRAQLQTSMP